MLAAISSAMADEATCAWHFAVSPVGRFNLLGEGVPISEPPSPTVFVEKGDRLVDLGATMREDLPESGNGWLLWNETRHLLIAHGDARTLAYTASKSRFDNQPLTASVTLSWYRGIIPGDPLPPDAKPVHRMKITGAAGAKLKGGWKGGPEDALTSIDCECESNIGDTPSGNTRLYLTWEERATKPLQWTFNGAMLYETGGNKPRILAQASSPAGSDWTLVASLQDYQIDGTRRQASQWREEDGKAILVAYPAWWTWKVPDRIQIGSGEKVLRYNTVLREEALTGARIAIRDSDTSILVGDDQPLWITFRKLLPETTVPAELKSFAPLPMLDGRPLAKALKQQVDDVAFMGYDPVSEKLLVAGTAQSPDYFDLEGCTLRSDFTASVTMKSVRQPEGQTEPGRKGVMLAGLSGQKTMLTCRPPGSDENEDELPLSMSFEIEPGRNDSPDNLDVRYQWKLEAIGNHPATTVEGQSKLINGKETSVQTNGDESKLDTISIRADIIHVHEATNP
ncbi:MAG: hypothetical protein QM755_01325 [Luteolibacter sp.]